MPMKIISIIIGCLMLTGPLYACFCNPNGFFIRSAKNKKSPYVVQVKIIRNGKSSPPEAEVIEVFKGKLNKKIIHLSGGASSCNVYFRDVQVGTTWFLALKKGGYWLKSKSEKIPFYSISICGIHHLKVVDGEVIGHITKESLNAEPQTMDIKSFKKLLKKELS